MWRTVLWIALAILVALLIAFLLTPHAPKTGAGAGGRAGRGGAGACAAGAAGATRRPPTVVGVATAALGDIPIEVTALGSVTSQANVTVQSQIAGTLTNVYFQEGQTVRQGQILAQIDDRPYLVQLQSAQGQLMRDQAALDEARLTLGRDRTLLAQDSIARQTVDDQAATVRQDEGVVKSDQASVASARLNIAYSQIKAPVPGRIGLRQIDPGNYVTANEPNGLVTINELDPITVIFTLPEDAIPQVATRMAAEHGLPVTAFDRTGQTVLAHGELYTLDNQIDSTTGTVKARARFANPDGTMFPNQFVNVTVLVDTVKNAVVIPAVAIRHGPQGDFVYVIQDDSTVKVTPVKVGPALGEQASVASGLNVGDQVVTDGGDRLSDGARVIQPKDAARMAAMAAAAAKKKPTGILGWIEGLFGHPAASGPSGYAGAGDQSSSSASSGQGGAARRAAMLAARDLTPDQQAKAKAIFADARTKAMAAGDDPDARRQIMQDANTQLEAILTPAQKAKFEAARAQARPAGAQSGAPAAASSGAPPAAPQSAAPAAAASSAPHGRHAQTAAASGAPPAGQPAGRPSGGPPGGGPGGPGGRGKMMDALGLDPAQKAQADAIFAAARAQAQGSTDPDARRAAMRGAMAKLDAILRPDQKAKLAALRAQFGAGRSGGQ